MPNEGKIIDRYDKSMLTEGDMNYYTPGNHITIIELKKYKIGFLICYDSCFPEIYNIYWIHSNKMMYLPENEIYHIGIPSEHPRAVNTDSQP